MKCYEPDYYVDRCSDLADDLKQNDLKEFANTATQMVEQLQNSQEIDQQELISASNVIFTGVEKVFK